MTHVEKMYILKNKLNKKINNESIFKEVIDLHNQFNEPYKIIKTQANTIHIPVLEMKYTSAFFQSKMSNLSPQLEDMITQIEIPLHTKVVQMVINMNEDFSEEYINHFGTYMKEGLIKHMRDIPIQFTNESIIAVGSLKIEMHPDVLSRGIKCIARTRSGVSISNKLREKVINNCHTHCKKCIKCMLIPQQCRLSWFVKSARS